MKVIELLSNMYYDQKVKLFLVDAKDMLHKDLIVSTENHALRSCIYKKYYDYEVVGFGIGWTDNTLDINLKEGESNGR